MTYVKAIKNLQCEPLHTFFVHTRI